MRFIRNWQLVSVIGLSLALSAWAQGGGGQGRGTAAGTAAAATQSAIGQQGAPGRGAQAATPQTGAPAGGRGARGGGASSGGASDFYDYQTSAAMGMVPGDAPPVESHQKITVNGETLAYTARVGYMALRNATTGQSEAHLFYTYYSKDGISDPISRPLVIFLGSAPGVATSWQEFGGFGPKKIKLMADGSAGPPPFSWADNPDTLLTQADLVFVNPVGTAFSRPDSPSRGLDFWTTNGDYASLGEFIRSFTNTYDRWNSPRVLAGQDFGTGRVAGLALYLTEHQIPVTGVALFSTTITAEATAGDEQYMTLLPTEILAAWYHKKLAPELQAMSADQIAEQARQFASRAYLHALYKGDRMTAEERTKVVADLSRLTGLSKPFIVNNDLRITWDRFNSELLRGEHRTLSPSDDRVSGYQAGGGGGGRGGFGGGPAGGGITGLDVAENDLASGFLNGYLGYLKRELGFNNNGIFYLLSGGIGTFTAAGNDDASLSGLFVRNPHLHVFVGLNYFDASAPFYAAEFTLAHLQVSPEARTRNITADHFEAGRMVYADAKALAKLHNDLTKFIADATAPAGR